MEEVDARVETHLKLRRLQVELEEYTRHLELARERLSLHMGWPGGAARLPAAANARSPGHASKSSLTTNPPTRSAATITTSSCCCAMRRAILLGDVAGKGVVAALLMAKLSADAKFAR